MHDFWPASGFAQLQRTPDGWLVPTSGYLRRFLELPELALLPESCAAETALHAALTEDPSRTVSPAELGALQDDDARSNYSTFLSFRDALLAAGTLEAYYLALMRAGAVAVPPAFIDSIVQAIARQVLDDSTDAFEARAAELLFRPQRVSISEGRVLCADRAVVDMLNETAGLGDIGRLLVQGKAPLRAVNMDVLTPDNATDYWRRNGQHNMLLDLTHEIKTDIGHGLQFTMSRTHSGLAALARVLQKWVAHFLGAQVTITPLHRIDDDAWRWHVGLDVESMALLNDLYEGRAVEPDRMKQLVGLFRLDVADRQILRPEIEGRPVYLGLATSSEGHLRLKPQNLLLNLPLATAT